MKYPASEQENLFSMISDKIDSYNDYELRNMCEFSIQNWESLSVQKAKVAIYPTLQDKSKLSQVLDNLDNLKESFQRIAERVNQQMLESERGKKLIATAEEYGIPYNKDDIDWLHLMDLVQEYEALLKQAKECNLDWDTGYYDPIELEQKIEEHLFHESREERRDLYWYYLSTRL